MDNVYIIMGRFGSSVLVSKSEFFHYIDTIKREYDFADIVHKDTTNSDHYFFYDTDELSYLAGSIYYK